MSKNTIIWRGKEWDLDYKPPRLTQELMDDLYKNKKRKGVRELVATFYTTHYELFRRFVIDTKDKTYIKWFLTSSPDVYKDVIKGVLQFHNYRILHELNTHKIGLTHMLHMMEGDLTATSIVKGTVPYEKLI